MLFSINVSLGDGFVVACQSVCVIWEMVEQGISLGRGQRHSTAVVFLIFCSGGISSSAACLL